MNHVGRVLRDRHIKITIGEINHRRLELLPFRYRDPLTRKWVRARYVAERHVIAERYAEYEIIGPPAIGDVDPDARYFNPAGGERRMVVSGEKAALK